MEQKVKEVKTKPFKLIIETDQDDWCSDCSRSLLVAYPTGGELRIETVQIWYQYGDTRVALCRDCYDEAIRRTGESE